MVLPQLIESFKKFGETTNGRVEFVEFFGFLGFLGFVGFVGFLEILSVA